MINITKIYFLHRGDNVPFYIGKTKTKLKGRIYGHKYHFGFGVQIEEIDEVPTSEWRFWEKYYISLFKSWGFNLENKNEGGGGLTNLTQKHKDSISSAWKNKSKEELTIINDKRRKGNLGKKKPGAGRNKLFTQEQKIALGNRSYYKTEEFLVKIKKKVLMLDKTTNKIIRTFNSITEAANFIGVTQPTLSTCLIGRSKTSGGYKWIYKEDLEA